MRPGTALAALGLALPLVVASSASDTPAPSVPADAVEAAYRANNVGVALLEQFRHDDAVASFRKALALDPALALARANLAIALFNVPKLEEARLEARAAAAALPGVPQPHYVLGLAARGLGATEEARAAFRAVLASRWASTSAPINMPRQPRA